MELGSERYKRREDGERTTIMMRGLLKGEKPTIEGIAGYKYAHTSIIYHKESKHL